MSGGVDSSVAAALLKRAGFDVVGIFMKFWSEPLRGAGENRCCSPEAEKRARMVGRILGIPFYVFNFEKEFKKKIVNYFLEGYKAGRTPNPCVLCNKEIKFGLLLEKALSLNANFIATGHYAKISRSINSTIVENVDQVKLLRARDKEKDQSYFLWRLNQNQLKHILFPVGGYTKSQVRALAKKFRLPVSDTPESMEICFIQTTINDFLKKNIKEKIGKIIDTSGKTIGQHKGLWFYTIGQRKGVKLPQGPFYVLDKKPKRNILVVTKNKKDLYKKELIAKNINWIGGKAPKLPQKVMAKIRYRQKAMPAIIKEYKRGIAKIIFLKPQRAITPGQSVVFYEGQELLGGGIIQV